MPLAVILSLVGTLAAASIAATVTLYVKRLDRWNAAELRHSEAREEAYEAYLAACDRAWHLRAKQAIDRHLNTGQVLSDEKFKEIADAVGQQVSSALEEIQRHASNFEKAGPILLHLYHLAFEQNPPNVAGFEDARLSMLEVKRAEEGLRKKLRNARKTSLIERLKERQRVRRILSTVTTIRAVSGPQEDEVIIHQDHGTGEGLMYLMNQIVREWEDLQHAVTLQEERSRRWKSRGLWPE